MKQSFAVILFVIAYIGHSASASWINSDEDWERLLKYNNETNLGLTEDELKSFRFGVTYPGTKWCGPGSIAANYDDLGTEKEADSCCRAHDNCPDLIKAFQTKYNLTNLAPYTRVSCDCDEEFLDCLHNANTRTANNVGDIYFNVLMTQCFRQDYPVTGCKERGGFLNSKCLEYEYDTSGEKRYQWFDVPSY